MHTWCWAGCPSGRFSSFHRGTLEHCVWPSGLIGHFTQFRWPAISQKSPGGSETSSIYGWWRPLCSLGLSKWQKYFCTLHQICASKQSCLGCLQTFPCGTLYIDRCVPFQMCPISWIHHRYNPIKRWRLQYLWTCDFLVFYFNKFAKISKNVIRWCFM